MKPGPVAYAVMPTTVAFTPKGGCPLKRKQEELRFLFWVVAFTPKGGC